jgi:cyclopropane fatty-acyl-phospholipid synthase-like methyltransferase
VRPVARLVWGIDMGPLYSSIDELSNIGSGATVLDVPCGGGIAMRGLRPSQDVRYIAVDLLDETLARAERRAERQGCAKRVSPRGHAAFAVSPRVGRHLPVL